MRKGLALERLLKWRIEVRSETPVAEEQRKKPIVFSLSFFFLSRGSKRIGK